MFHEDFIQEVKSGISSLFWADCDDSIERLLSNLSKVGQVGSEKTLSFGRFDKADTSSMAAFLAQVEHMVKECDFLLLDRRKLPYTKSQFAMIFPEICTVAVSAGVKVLEVRDITEQPPASLQSYYRVAAKGQKKKDGSVEWSFLKGLGQETHSFAPAANEHHCACEMSLLMLQGCQCGGK